MMTNPSSDIAFTPTVKAAQTRHGSRTAYAAMEAKGSFRIAIDTRMREALAEANSAYLVTANADGQPYAQHRGGPRGFIRVIDDRTIGFADYTGNQQYVSTGNLADNPKAFLFLMDYAHRRRVKIWGRAGVVEGDAALNAQLMPHDYKAQAQAAILFEISAWDINCPQHIPQKFDAADVAQALAKRDSRISELEAELAAVRSRLAFPSRHRPP